MDKDNQKNKKTHRILIAILAVIVLVGGVSFINYSKEKEDALKHQKSKLKDTKEDLKETKDSLIKSKNIEDSLNQEKESITQEKERIQKEKEEKEKLLQEKESEILQKQQEIEALQQIKADKEAKALKAEPTVYKAESAPVAKNVSEQAPVSSGGKQVTVQATAYSISESGMSTHTFTGIDLRNQPNVIAVDPSVIPLGSRVLVNGSEYIAGDTGGAIVGNIIDIHFQTVEECIQWGRRTITVTIL